MQSESGGGAILTFAVCNFHFAMAEGEERLIAES
jgi:hypothetical protein